MLGFSFGRSIQQASAFLLRDRKVPEVQFDCDRLRTTLLQCELEIREMHRLCNVKTADPNSVHSAVKSRY